MATPNIVPRADSEGQLGTASKYWAAAYIDLIYLGAGKIGRDADNLLDFSVDNEVTFRVNAADEMVLGASTLSPHASDGLALGTSSLMWSDLFLADGAVINFNNGNLTLTHSNNALTLGDNDVMKFGADGDLFVYHSGSNGAIDNYTGNLTITNDANGADLIFQCDDASGGTTPYITLDGGATRINVAKSMYFADSIEAAWGTNEDFTISHLSGDNYLTNDIGNMYIRQRANNGDMLLQCDDGSGGVATYLTLDGSDPALLVAKKMVFSDNTYLYVGGGADLQIVHNGTDSQVTNTTGNLQFTNTADDKDISFASDNGNGGDAIYFYLDGSSATYSGGATTALYTNWPDKSIISLGTSHDLKIYHDGSSTYMENGEGNFNIMQRADGADLIFSCDDGSTGDTAYLTLDGGAEKIYMYKSTVFTGGGMDYGVDGTGADVIFYGDTAGRDMKWDQSEDHLLFKDNTKLKLGTGGDLELYHDTNNSYIDETGTGLLYIRGDAGINITAPSGGEVYAKFIKDGACEFRHNDGTRLVTTATGVSVTGVAAAAVGGGFDGAETVTVSIGEVNQETITTIQIDLGTGGATDIVSSGVAGDVIGENDTAAAYITKYDSTKNGVLYKAELICLETPAGGDTDINLVLNASSLAEDAASETEGHVIIDGGAQTIGMRTESTASVITAAAGAHNDYIYLAHGGTTAGTYTAGKFLIRLYGALATL